MTVAAIDRCLTILEALAGEREPVELTDLAHRVDVPASAVHRTLSTLVDRGWVVQHSGTQRYALSLRMSTLAFRNLDVRAVPDVVQSVLDKLARETREYCRLAIVEGEDLVWVARAQGAVTGLRYDPEMGQEIVLHATANGKAWLATLPETEALRIVCARGFEARRPLGPHSATNVDELRDALAAGARLRDIDGEPRPAHRPSPFLLQRHQPGAPVAGTKRRRAVDPHQAGTLREIADALKRAAHDVAGSGRSAAASAATGRRWPPPSGRDRRGIGRRSPSRQHR